MTGIVLLAVLPTILPLIVAPLLSRWFGMPSWLDALRDAWRSDPRD